MSRQSKRFWKDVITATKRVCETYPFRLNVHIEMDSEHVYIRMRELSFNLERTQTILKSRLKTALLMEETISLELRPIEQELKEYQLYLYCNPKRSI